MLTVSDLSVSRGGVLLLEGVAFAAAPGEAVVLRGPNGIGKTSLLRCLAGLQPATGRIDMPPESATYAAHADGVKSTLTVAENLTFHARLHGARDIAAAMDAFDIAHLADRPGSDLSAGQRRRLGLARLLVTGRSIWLLDEPTVSLDAASTALFEAALASHLGAGGTAVLSTHLPIAQGREVDLRAFRPKASSTGGRGNSADGGWL